MRCKQIGIKLTVKKKKVHESVSILIVTQSRNDVSMYSTEVILFDASKQVI